MKQRLLRAWVTWGWKAAFLLVVLSGLLNVVSASWSPYFRLNLLLHPLLGIGVAAWAIRKASADLVSHTPGLSPELLLAFAALVTLGCFRVFPYPYFTADEVNVFSGRLFALMAAACLVLFVRGRRVDLSGLDVPGTGAQAAGLAAWSMALVSGMSFLVLGGGRSLAVVLYFHSVAGGLAALVGFLALVGGVRGRVRELALAVGVAAALAVGVPSAVNGIGRLWQPAPAAREATVHLSTIPLERRLPEERDVVPFPIDARWVDISASCGATDQCHADLLEDHRNSVHHASYATPHLQKNLALLATEIGRPNQVLCAGCHTPTVLFTGGGRTEDYVQRENMSCVFCHVISDVSQSEDPRKSSYSIDLPADHLSMFLDAERAGGDMDLLTGLLIRLNVRAHGRAFKNPLQSEDRFCMACHHLQLRGVVQGRTCVQCHMEPRSDLELSGRAKNHLFLGSNTVIPALLGTPQVARLTERWMQGQFLERALGFAYGTQVFPRVRDDVERLGDFDYLDMTVEFDGPLAPGTTIPFRVLTRNVGVGHAFPSSAMDLQEVWLAVRVTDETGRLLFESGGLDAANQVQAGSHQMGGQVIGMDGHVLTHNRVWQIREKVLDREILPGAVGIDAYEMRLATDCGRLLNVEAEWRYRKLNQDYWEWAYGPYVTNPAPFVARTLRQFPVVQGVPAVP